MVCAENGIGVARVIDDDDARLIAAAPMMLEALEAVFADFGKGDGSMFISTMQQVKAAIKAAKGGEI